MSQEDMRKKLIELIEPLVEGKGFELVHLDYGGGRGGYVRLFIDCEGGTTIDHCELISRAVSDLLDSLDPIAHAYTLEVSSPGLERPLRKKEHFMRFRGEKIKVKTSEPLEGRKKFSGTIADTGTESVFVRLDDGTEVEIPLKSIAKANLWLGNVENR